MSGILDFLQCQPLPASLTNGITNRKMYIPAYNAHNSRNSPHQFSPRGRPFAHSPSPDWHPPKSHQHSSSTSSHLGRVSEHRYCAEGQRLWRQDSAPIARLRRRGSNPRSGRDGGLMCFWILLRALIWCISQMGLMKDVG